jgi:hypothetical protein
MTCEKDHLTTKAYAIFPSKYNSLSHYNPYFLVKTNKKRFYLIVSTISAASSSLSSDFRRLPRPFFRGQVYTFEADPNGLFRINSFGASLRPPPGSPISASPPLEEAGGMALQSNFKLLVEYLKHIR